MYQGEITNLDTTNLQRLLTNSSMESVNEDQIRIIFNDTKSVQEFQHEIQKLGIENRGMKGALRKMQVLPADLENSKERYAITLTNDEWQKVQNRLQPLSEEDIFKSFIRPDNTLDVEALEQYQKELLQKQEQLKKEIEDDPWRQLSELYDQVKKAYFRRDQNRFAYLLFTDRSAAEKFLSLYKIANKTDITQRKIEHLAKEESFYRLELTVFEYSLFEPNADTYVPSLNVMQPGLGKMTDKNYVGAIEDFTKAIAIDPQNIEAFWLRCGARAKADDHQGALEDLKQVMESAPPEGSDKSLIVLRGELKRNAADYKGAIADFSQAINLGSSEPILFFSRGLAYLFSEKSGLAIKDFDQAITLNANYADAYIFRGSAKFNLKDYAGCIADVTKGLTLDPQNTFASEALETRGDAKVCINDDTGAIEDFTRALDLNKKNVETLFKRANAFCNLQDYTKAIKDFDVIISLDPKSAKAWAGRGTLKIILRDFQTGMEEVNYALVLDPNDEALKLAVEQSKQLIPSTIPQNQTKKPTTPAKTSGSSHQSKPRGSESSVFFKDAKDRETKENQRTKKLEKLPLLSAIDSKKQEPESNSCSPCCNII